MEDPKDMLTRVKISDEDKSNIKIIVSNYPEIRNLEQGFLELFPKHETLFITALFIDNKDLLLYQHHLFLQGLIVRSKRVLEALLREIIKENMPAAVSLLRSQCETLAAACYLEKFPDKLRSMLFGSRDGSSEQAPNILTQIDHADKKYKGLRANYDHLSELVHPNAASLFSPVKIIDEATRHVLISSAGSFSRENAVELLRVAYHWATWFLETSESIDKYFKKTIEGYGLSSKS